MTTPAEKTCTKCGEVKPLSGYHRAPKGLYGHTAQCKACRNAYQRTYLRRLKAERVEPATPTEKTCTGCGETKPYTEYHRNASSKDGLRSRCKACQSARRKAYYAANREAALACRKAYYEANRERYLARHAERWETDPEYRARRKAATTRYHRLLASAKQEPYTRESIFARDGWTCGLCGEPIDRDLRAPDPGSPSIDHVIPLSRGGDDTPANVQAAHFGCNSGKCNRVAHEDEDLEVAA